MKRQESTPTTQFVLRSICRDATLPMTTAAPLTDPLRTDDPAVEWHGHIGRTLRESTPYWPAPRRAPVGAPDVVVVLLDDLGYSDLGCYGAEIRTKAIDSIARRGMRFVNYTTVPMCTPARAALLTGKNPHAVGCGWLTFNDPGFPGYRGGEMTRDTPTLAETLRANGYSTYMVGKWHNTSECNTTASSDRSSWPLARGFDRFYGFLGAETNYFAPSQLIEDNTLLTQDIYAQDYYCTDDWTDRAIVMLKEHVSNAPSKPFFLYVAHNAPHAPLHAKSEDLARYRGTYDRGWDAIRSDRMQRQQALGLFPECPKPSPHSPGVKDWNALSPDQRRVMARYMELYAAVVDNMDQNLGRLLDALASIGRIDNTIIVVTSDNGANGVGGPEGAANNLAKRLTNSEDSEWVQQCLQNDTLGRADSWPAYPLGWTDVSTTPFRLYKTTTMNGGIRVPFILQWPARWSRGNRIEREWVHVTDVTPTILDLIGVEAPKVLNGFRTRPQDGVSFRDVLETGAPSRRSSQHYELAGNRGYISGNWKIVSLQPPGKAIDLSNWMLFNLVDDPTELHDLANEQPEKLLELVSAFDREAYANYVYPLDNRGLRRSLTVPPNREAFVNESRTFFPGTGTVAAAAVAPLVADRSYRLTCAFDWNPGARGVIFAFGDAIFGFALYARDDELHFHYRGSPRQGVDMPSMRAKSGRNEFVLDYAATGQRNGIGTIYLGNLEVGSRDMSPTIILGLNVGEGLDIGCDRRLHVTAGYGGTGICAYTEAVHFVRIEPGPQATDSYANKPERLSQME